jgi:hypothetical protein
LLRFRLVVSRRFIPGRSQRLGRAGHHRVIRDNTGLVAGDDQDLLTDGKGRIFPLRDLQHRAVGFAHDVFPSPGIACYVLDACSKQTTNRGAANRAKRRVDPDGAGLCAENAAGGTAGDGPDRSIGVDLDLAEADHDGRINLVRLLNGRGRIGIR